MSDILNSRVDFLPVDYLPQLNSDWPQLLWNLAKYRTGICINFPRKSVVRDE